MAKRNANGLFMTARHEFEMELVDQIIAKEKGNKTQAAKALGISYATLKTVVRSRKQAHALSAGDKALAEAIRKAIFARLRSEEPTGLREAIATYRADVRKEAVERIIKAIG